MRKSWIRFLNQRCKFFDDSGNLIAYCKASIRSDTTVFTDASRTQELLTLENREKGWLRLRSATFDILAGPERNRLGVIHRCSKWKPSVGSLLGVELSFMQDGWQIDDYSGSRMLCTILKKDWWSDTWYVDYLGQEIGTIERPTVPFFGPNASASLGDNAPQNFDRRFILAVLVFMALDDWDSTAV
jgi:hypothetical protein